MSRLDNFKGN